MIEINNKNTHTMLTRLQKIDIEPTMVKALTKIIKKSLIFLKKKEVW